MSESTERSEEHQQMLDAVTGLPHHEATRMATMMGALKAAERHEDARLVRQKFIDDGCRIKVTCSPRERKWRVMVWTDYKTRKDDDGISIFKGWTGSGPFEGKGDTETEATENLIKMLKEKNEAT